MVIEVIEQSQNEFGIIIALVLATFGIVFFSTIRYFLGKIRTLQENLAKKQSMASQMGKNSALGDMYQILGEFAILPEYDELIILSTTSRQASLDLIGIKNGWMDFLELKKLGARITPSENKIRKIIEEKKVRYIVKDIEIPAALSVTQRELPKLKPSKITKGE